MTDIVERLHEMAGGVVVSPKICQEAISEIVRLRSALDKIDTFIMAISPRPTKELASIRREIRDALRPN